nr:MAG TPA: hypothetical protein [Caudoviricetes sp.]
MSHEIASCEGWHVAGFFTSCRMKLLLYKARRSGTEPVSHEIARLVRRMKFYMFEICFGNRVT